MVAIRPKLGQGWPDVETRPQDVVALWEERLSVTGEMFRGLSPPAILLSREGDPVSEILQVAQETGAGLLVLGTRGRGHLATHLLGSVATELVRQSPIPTLVIPELA